MNTVNKYNNPLVNIWVDFSHYYLVFKRYNCEKSCKVQKLQKASQRKIYIKIKIILYKL